MQFGIERFVAFGPIDAGMDIRKQEGREVGQEMLECFFPGRIIIRTTRSELAHGVSIAGDAEPAKHVACAAMQTFHE